MIRNPLVSIILPTYNGERYLDQSIQSCFDQTYTNWELIIVDDCSKDETPRIITGWIQKDPRVRSIRNEANKKLPASLNIGFSQATGEYCTWTSDDNLYRPNAILEMVGLLETNHDIDIVYSDYTKIDDDGKPYLFKKVLPIQELVLGNSIGPSFLYRRTVHEQLKGYAEDLYLAEDYDFWLRASILFKFQHLASDLYLYRSHRNSLTSTQGLQPLINSYEALRRNLPKMVWASKTTRAKGYLHLAIFEQNNRNMQVVKKYLLQVITLSPRYITDTSVIGLSIDVLFGQKAFLVVQRIFRKFIINTDLK